MIELKLKLDLPAPWTNGSCDLDEVGLVNFLVGPNGSGKSRFADALAQRLTNSRFLRTDRLSGMEQHNQFQGLFDQHFGDGLPQNQLDRVKRASSLGSGLAALALLEERMDLRIQLEATLGHLFDRDIRFEWNSGNLLVKTRRRDSGASYRLDREECHGIKELCVLLTNLYDDRIDVLIIDEPELNLHPQNQAFFMREVRKVAGNPNEDANKKIIFLVTHSPFILDFRSFDDLKSVISFSLNYSEPKRLTATLQLPTSAAFVMNRLKSEQKQLFFSDNPIFVKGILDAQIVAALMEARGHAIEGAGSCIIDVGGAEEVNHCLDLCRGLGKDAHFVYDLDSLFDGNLKSCLNDDREVGGFLLTAGFGSHFGTYFGQLERSLTKLIDHVQGLNLPAPLARLADYLNGLGDRRDWKGSEWAKARTAVMVAVDRHQTDLESLLDSDEIRDVVGRRDRIIELLNERNIHVLPGGTLERYLPEYNGDPYEITDAAKKSAVIAELEYLALPRSDADLAECYGNLYTAVASLPSKAEVDAEPVILGYLRDFVYQVQKSATMNPQWQHAEIDAFLNEELQSLSEVFSLSSFDRIGEREFKATIDIKGILGRHPSIAHVDDATVAGTGNIRMAPISP